MDSLPFGDRGESIAMSTDFGCKVFHIILSAFPPVRLGVSAMKSLFNEIPLCYSSNWLTGGCV